MAKRRYEVEVRVTIIVEIDDEITSDYYEGETLLTAHLNRERFNEGATHKDAIGALSITHGLWHSSDGWADFPRGAYWTQVTDAEVDSVVGGEVVSDG